MNSEKQKLLIEYLVNDVSVYGSCSGIIKAAYFNPEFRQSIVFIQQYYNIYNTIPDISQIKAETGLILEERIVKIDQIEYCKKEIEKFCKQKALVQALMDCAPLVSIENPSEIDVGRVQKIIGDATAVSLDSDLGIVYNDDIRSRMEKLRATEVGQSTGWRSFDNCLDKGICRKQLLLFAAGSGGGKSLVMANLGLNFLQQGFDVLYITLELAESFVSKRFDSMIAGMSAMGWDSQIPEMAKRIEKQMSLPGMGQLTIKYMNSGSTSNNIRSYLKEYELKNTKTPDMLIVDYLDLLGPNYRISDNVFEKDKACSEQLRNIGNDYNMWVITASQLNRSAVEAEEFNHSHIAGGISKINTCDAYVAIRANDQLKNAGKIRMHFLKTRSSDGFGKTIDLSWNTTTLRITDDKHNESDMKFVPKTQKNDDLFEETTGNDILTFFDKFDEKTDEPPQN